VIGVGEHVPSTNGDRAAASDVLLSVEHLNVEFTGRHGTVRVVDDVSFEVPRGAVSALVGESGSGKTVTSLAIAGLLPDRQASVSGRIVLDGVDLLELSRRSLRARQGTDVAMVFQEPMSSLNPAFTVGDQIAESLRHHVGSSRREARTRAIDLLQQVGIPHASRRVDSYPHEFSGGMRQRVMLAIALACEPKLLIADEPTTALDVTIQAQILELIGSLCRDRGVSVLLITHDFGVVAELADEVTVLYAGEIVEGASVYELFEQPRHPYSESLIRAAVGIEQVQGPDGAAARGMPPVAGKFPPGCRFAPRCDHATPQCVDEHPVLTSGTPGRRDRCVRSDELTLIGSD
jgi:peptide/nickel transport system ATP-binding protein